jgi:hypothetical protein
MHEQVGAQMNDIIVRYNRAKVLCVSAGGLILAGACLWLFKLQQSGDLHPSVIDPLHAALLPYILPVGGTFFGLGATASLYRALSDKPVLIIKDHGLICDNIFISWNEIDRIDVLAVTVRSSTTRFLRIFLKYPDNFLSQASWLTRFNCSLNKLFYGATIYLGGRSLTLGVEEIEATIKLRVASSSSPKAFAQAR